MVTHADRRMGAALSRQLDARWTAILKTKPSPIRIGVMGWTPSEFWEAVDRAVTSAAVFWDAHGNRRWCFNAEEF